MALRLLEEDKTEISLPASESPFSWYIVSDVFESLAKLPDNSVDFIATSPPFLALRSYLPADHPDKSKEIGSEPTPAAFIDVLMDLTEEWARVLAPYGSIAVELGDTYSGSGVSGGDYNKGGWREDLAAHTAQTTNGNGNPVVNSEKDRWAKSDKRPGWPLAKSLAMIPELYRIALSYGVNPLNPSHTMEPWRVRNVVRWHRPNPAVGALGDKFRPSTSEMVIATKSKTRWFDLDAVRVPSKDPQEALRPRHTRSTEGREGLWDKGEGRFGINLNGAPPLDTWIIPTEPYKGSHYATFPRRLVETPVKSMCPKEVCNVCGEPRRRILERERESCPNSSGGKGRNGRQVADLDYSGRTVGWTDCGHGDFRPGIVLDPFAGSGTTLEVAAGLGRSGIGIDIDERNFNLAQGRELLGMFLEKVEVQKWGHNEVLSCS